jgi:hypothetical protein
LKTGKRAYVLAAVSAVLFFAITMPFREFFSVMEVTELRPAGALPPTFGLMLGFPGALGCAIGNLAADIVSGYSVLLCALGFMAQLFYGVLPLALWNRMKRKSEEDVPFFRLNTVNNVIRYIEIILVDAVLMAAILGAIMAGTGISPFLSMATLMLFLNNFVFCMLFGMPLIIFMGLGKHSVRQAGMTLNERLILIFLLFVVLSAALIGTYAYVDVSHNISDPLLMWNRIYVYVLVDLILFFLIAIVFLRYSERNFTVPIETISNLSANYVSGDREKKNSAYVVAECEKFSDLKGEAGVLARAFKTMTLDLDGYIENLTKVTAEKERIDAELNVATQIQSDMLPHIFPPFPDRPEIDLFGVMKPAKEVGGDFYDFFFVDDDTLAVVVADVSGKGVPAALFMVIGKTLIKNNAQMGKSPEEVFKTVNNVLCENNDGGLFITCFMGYLNLVTGDFTSVNAGHNPPLLKRDGKYAYYKTQHGLVLAGLEDMVYKRETVTLKRGDTLYLYTDGVTEANNPAEELYGEKCLLETINENADLPVRELCAAIWRDVEDFVDGAEQMDDITMLALKFNC